MSIKDPQQKLENITKRIKQLEIQKRQIEKKENEKERRARTRRLIQIGAIIEGMGINNEKIAKDFKNYFENNDDAREFIQKIILKIRNDNE